MVAGQIDMRANEIVGAEDVDPEGKRPARPNAVAVPVRRKLRREIAVVEMRIG
jgi:hypothetical protein